MADPRDMMRRPGGGVSRATVKSLIKRFSGGGGAPMRAVLPVFDGDLPPGLAYRGDILSAAVPVVIRGKNLTGITVVDPSVDVKVGGNIGLAPVVVGPIFVADTSITLTLDCTPSGPLDLWGILLRDAAGNVYGAPSPIAMNAPL